MYLNQGVANEIQSARGALVFIALVIVLFWRLVLRVMLAVLAIAVMVVIGAGALVLLDGLHL